MDVCMLGRPCDPPARAKLYAAGAKRRCDLALRWMVCRSAVETNQVC
jgi:hypothetical protein